jgi:hypothetical protein
MRCTQVWDPEEGRLLRDHISHGSSFQAVHLFESAERRHLLAIMDSGEHHPRHPGDTSRDFLDVWDLGEQAPVGGGGLQPAHKHG